MTALTERDQKTARLGAIAVAIYLALFFGWRGWNYLEARRAEYRQLVTDAQRLKRDLMPYENRVLLAQKLKEAFHLDPEKLSTVTLVAEASAAIQKAAAMGGVQVGPIRESPARSSARELTSMQLEGMGPVPAVITLIHRLESIGFPLVIDSIQLGADATKPGVMKINFTVVILNFGQWKIEEKPHA
jgi:hypothetical protein